MAAWHGERRPRKARPKESCAGLCGGKVWRQGSFCARCQRANLAVPVPEGFSIREMIRRRNGSAGDAAADGGGGETAAAPSPVATDTDGIPF